MGWLFYARTRKELIDDLTQQKDCDRLTRNTIATALVDNCLWTVVELTGKQDNIVGLQKGETMQLICCDLLECSDGKWGYKHMDESASPFYYSCPLAFLEMAPVISREWRDGVVKYHAERVQGAMAVTSIPST